MYNTKVGKDADGLAILQHIFTIFTTEINAVIAS